MRLIISKLILRAFRSVEDSSLQLPERGLCLLQGRNKDTGGSSGAGKTNIFQGVATALGFSDYTGPEQQSWFFDQPPEVQLTVKPGDEDPSVIIRSSKPRVIPPNGIHITGAVAINAEIRRICGGLAPDVVRALTYMRQDEKDSFLTLTSAQKFDFLTTVLPEITKLEKIGEKAAAEAAAGEAKINALAQKILDIGPQREKYQGHLKTTEEIPALKAEAEQVAGRITALKAEIEAEHAAQDVVKHAVELKKAELQSQFTLALAPVSERLGAAQRQVGAASAIRLLPHPDKQVIIEKLAECGKHLQKELGLDEERRKAILNKSTTLTASRHALDRDIDRLNALADRLPKMRRDVEVLDKNTCPTCSNTWLNAKQKANQITDEIREIEIALKSLEPQRAERERLTAELSSIPPWTSSPLVAKLKDIQVQLTKRGAELDAEAHRIATKNQNEELRVAYAELRSIEAEIAGMRSEHAKDLVRALEPLSQVDPQKIRLLEQAMENSRQMAVRVERRLAELQTWKQVAHMELAALDSTEAFLAGEMKAAQEIRRMSAAVAEVLSKQGFLSAIFQEVLDEISAETNTILSQVANTAEVTVGFITERETGSGTMRREIKAISTVRGHTTSLKAGCSGGMFAAVRLAIQLAVRRVVSRRMGVFPGWLILDEPFNGLGEVEKLTCMEILKVVGETDLVLVVDHATEFQELFDKVVVVTMEKGISKVEAP